MSDRDLMSFAYLVKSDAAYLGRPNDPNIPDLIDALEWADLIGEVAYLDRGVWFVTVPGPRKQWIRTYLLSLDYMSNVYYSPLPAHDDGEGPMPAGAVSDGLDAIRPVVTVPPAKRHHCGRRRTNGEPCRALLGPGVLACRYHLDQIGPDERTDLGPWHPEAAK